MCARRSKLSKHKIQRLNQKIKWLKFSRSLDKPNYGQIKFLFLNFCTTKRLFQRLNGQMKKFNAKLKLKDLNVSQTIILQSQI